MLLVIVWLGIAAGVTIWALRARREHRIDLTTSPEGLQSVDRIELRDVRVDEPDEQRRRA